MLSTGERELSLLSPYFSSKFRLMRLHERPGWGVWEPQSRVPSRVMQSGSPLGGPRAGDRPLHLPTA